MFILIKVDRAYQKGTLFLFDEVGDKVPENLRVVEKDGLDIFGNPLGSVKNKYVSLIEIITFLLELMLLLVKKNSFKYIVDDDK